MPVAVPQLLVACEFFLSEPRQIILVGDREAADTRALLRTLYAHFMPNRIALLVDSEETRDALAAGIPTLRAMTRLDGRAAAYVCQNYTCQLPVSEAGQLAELLQ
jgi:uncharacterized protein YyaL (SSP411 family)